MKFKHLFILILSLSFIAGSFAEITFFLVDFLILSFLNVPSIITSSIKVILSSAAVFSTVKITASIIDIFHCDEKNSFSA